eukprot:TRINITY_DN1569_c0_g1_i1.p2 TRINITY_DN1569_c0_g1~~TRINITY_DN1569_c0_g1_i1.p2  ORF type:complete len:196 (+),score=41.36 TRINITY_DN1569_c0_g1_i1:72-590(+)
MPAAGMQVAMQGNVQIVKAQCSMSIPDVAYSCTRYQEGTYIVMIRKPGDAVFREPENEWVEKGDEVLLEGKGGGIVEFIDGRYICGIYSRLRAVVGDDDVNELRDFIEKVMGGADLSQFRNEAWMTPLQQAREYAKLPCYPSEVLTIIEEYSQSEMSEAEDESEETMDMDEL